MPWCHSALFIAPRCSFARTNLFVGLINHMKVHTTFLTLAPSDLVEGRFSWPRATWSSWRSKLSPNKDTLCLWKQWIKAGAFIPSPLGSVCSSQEGAAVAGSGLVPPCWYKLCWAVWWGQGSELLTATQEWQFSIFLTASIKPYMEIDEKFLCKAVLPQIRAVQAAAGLEHSPLFVSWWLFFHYFFWKQIVLFAWLQAELDAKSAGNAEQWMPLYLLCNCIWIGSCKSFQ